MAAKKPAGDLVDDLLSHLDDLTPEQIERLTQASVEKYKGIAEAKRKEVISEVRAQIAKYRLTAKECGFHGVEDHPQRAMKPAGEKRRLRVGEVPRRFVAWKYLNPETGEFWSGKGHTPPAWIRDLSEVEREKYRIDFNHPINQERLRKWELASDRTTVEHGAYAGIEMPDNVPPLVRPE